MIHQMGFKMNFVKSFKLILSCKASVLRRWKGEHVHFGENIHSENVGHLFFHLNNKKTASSLSVPAVLLDL